MKGVIDVLLKRDLVGFSTLIWRNLEIGYYFNPEEEAKRAGHKEITKMIKELSSPG